MIETAACMVRPGEIHRAVLHFWAWQWLRSSMVVAVGVALLVAVGCSGRSSSGDRLADNGTVAPLPEYLRHPPSDWGDATWKPFQTSLIKLRQPIARCRPYSQQELVTCTARVEHWPGEYEDQVKAEWDAKWRSRLSRYERTGGCGCCNEIYTVTGPRAAIEEFPTPRGRRESFPNYLDE